jgi:hypothetical protein
MKGMPKVTFDQAERILDQKIEELLRHGNVRNESSLHGRPSRSDLAATSVDEDPERDLYTECGYPRTITAFKYKALIEREGHARRANEIYPDETWAEEPEIFESDDETVETPLEKSWLEYAAKTRALRYMYLGDIASGIGRIGGLLFGFNDLSGSRKPEKPVLGLKDDGTRAPGRPPEDRQHLFTRVFDETLIQIVDVDNSYGPRHGQPTMYRLTLTTPDGIINSATEGTQRPISKKAATDETLLVHWTRFLPLADGKTTHPIFGTPRLESNYNRLLDLRKLYSASPEMFYNGAFPGYSLEALPDVTSDDDIDVEATQLQLSRYRKKLQRFVMLVGMTMKPLTPQIADPSKHVEVLLAAVAMAMGIPLRIFLGSESGHLASTQDVATWNKRLAKRQHTYVTPEIIIPYIERMQLVGCLPQSKQVKVAWADLNSSSDETQADVALKTTQALLQYAKSGAEEFFPLPFFLAHVLKYNRKLVSAIVKEAQKRGRLKLTRKVWEQEKAAPIGGTGKKQTGAKTGRKRNATSSK